jgi:hypothetical protein
MSDYQSLLMDHAISLFLVNRLSWMLGTMYALIIRRGSGQMLCVKGCAMGLGKYDMKTRSIVESGIRENRIESEAGLTKKTGKRKTQKR